VKYSIEWYTSNCNYIIRTVLLPTWSHSLQKIHIYKANYLFCVIIYSISGFFFLKCCFIFLMSHYKCLSPQNQVPFKSICAWLHGTYAQESKMSNLKWSLPARADKWPKANGAIHIVHCRVINSCVMTNYGHPLPLQGCHGQTGDKWSERLVTDGTGLGGFPCKVDHCLLNFSN